MKGAILLYILVIGGIMQQPNFGPSVVFLSVKKEAPFQAEFEESISLKQPNGEIRQRSMTGAIYRDSRGRYRREMLQKLGNGKTFKLVYIHDPDAKVAHLINEAEKSMVELPFQTLNEQNDQSRPDIEAEAQNSNLPVKFIEGIACYEYHIRQLNGGELEFWFSMELGIVLLEKKTNESGEKIIRLFNINRTEPDSGLFLVPSYYKRVTIPGLKD